mgnify:CR=1 FL=1
MSELGFTGKIPIPNLKQVGDLSGEITRQQQIQLQSGALRSKQQAAKAQALKDLQANQAAVRSQMGGLYDNVHPFALPFVEQAAEKLEEQALMFMQMENGAELFKPMVADFKASVEPLKLNQEMMQNRGNLTAMVDPNSQTYKAANKEVGKLFNVVANEDMVFAADDHQFRDLLKNAYLDYDNGRFKIMGQSFNRATGETADEVTELSVAPMFNDPTEYQYSTRRANVKSLQQIGEDIKAVDTRTAQNSGWDAERVTETNAKLFTDFVDFDAMAETDNNEYAFRLAAFFDTRDDVMARNNTAANFKNEEDLLKYYELDPKLRETGDTQLYDLVQGAIEDAWKTKTLPHTKWELKDTKSSGQIKLDILDNSAASALALTELPINPETNKPVEGIVVDADSKKIRSVVYPIQEIPSVQAENIKVTYINPDYYNNMRIYLDSNNSKGQPYATINDFGKIELGIIEKPEGYDNRKQSGILDAADMAYEEDRAQAGAIAQMMQEDDFMKESSVDGIRFYQNNPTLYVLSMTDGTQLLIDRSKLDKAPNQMAHASMKIGLQKANLTHDDLWNDASGKFGTSASRVDAFGNPIE